MPPGVRILDMSENGNQIGLDERLIKLNRKPIINNHNPLALNGIQEICNTFELISNLNWYIILKWNVISFNISESD